MGKPTGFLEFTRELPAKRPPQERINDYDEFIERYSDEKLNQQAARCMDCGIPFCHHSRTLARLSWEEKWRILFCNTNKALYLIFGHLTTKLCTFL